MSVSIPSSGSIQFLRIHIWQIYTDQKRVSIPSSGSIQFLQKRRYQLFSFGFGVSIPSSGSIQFLRRHWFRRIRVYDVSIPSSGSIQFLHMFHLSHPDADFELSQSPQAGQFNSYSRMNEFSYMTSSHESQSPQAGQFNSYLEDVPEYYLWQIVVSIPSSGSIQFLQNIQKQNITSM